MQFRDIIPITSTVVEQQLESYNLADAVKFNDVLNPRIWGKDKKMIQVVRDHLLQIAEDFRDFLGVTGYELKDITVSGSNAAYTYTPNSDIDLHLVVDLPLADSSDLYRELFDAKKFQYNERHSIGIFGYTVELYVQDANKKHISQGIYSVLNDEWNVVPKRMDAGVDDISTRSKYEDLVRRIDDACSSGDKETTADLMKTIQQMRQAGLDKHGEFGPENLAFKMLRNQGYIKRLVDARNRAKDVELSLKERAKVGTIEDDSRASTEVLFELNMSPTSLRQLAGAITDAKAGMEFEMIVPNTSDPDWESEQSPDYVDDPRVFSIEDVAEFFNDGDLNGRFEIDRLTKKMTADFDEWCMEEVDDEWSENITGNVYAYVKDNLETTEIAEILGFDEDETDELRDRGPTIKNFEDATNLIVSEQLASTYYYDAKEDFEKNWLEDVTELKWLRAEGLTHMSDIETTYEIMWPHWTSDSNSDDEQSIEETAKEFGSMIGKPVKWSEQYHGAKRDATSYILEPDGSLEGNDGDTGLEFVSPPMAIADMLSDLDKTVKWAGLYGCYTNKSTGLHINVSVPGTEDRENIDYVKLALLLGDNYILEQFGRAGNTYCKSGMAIIKERVSQRPEDAQELLTKMRNGLDAMASRLIHSGQTNKFTSINMKDGYVEFRSPGGNWLEEYASGGGKIENALLRFVVALDAATKPELYKQDYLKKLYAMLQPKSKDDTIAYFAKFAAGELPKAALKSFVRQAQLERQGKKGVSSPADTMPPNYYIVDSITGEVVKKFYATSKVDAYEYFLVFERQNPAGDFSYGELAELQSPDNAITGPTPTPGRAVLPPAQGGGQRDLVSPGAWTGQWLIKDIETGAELYRFGGIGNSQADANRHAAQWIRNTNYSNHEVEVVPEIA